MSLPHPLQDLSLAEVTQARDIILSSYSEQNVEFRQIGLQEPKKSEVVQFLDREHAKQDLATAPRPDRLAKCHFDVLADQSQPVQYREATINLGQGMIIDDHRVPPTFQAPLTMCAPPDPSLNWC